MRSRRTWPANFSDSVPTPNEFQPARPDDFRRLLRRGRQPQQFMTQLMFVCLAVLAGAGAISLRADGIAGSRNYLTNITVELRHQWPTNRTINLSCHGHSRPDGYFKT